MMAEQYDWSDPCVFQELPDELKDMHMDAVQGLFDGDPAPLAAYIRAGYAVDGSLAYWIAAAIKGEYGYRFILKGTKKGQRPQSERFAKYQRELEIGIWVEQRLRAAAPGEFESVISDAITEFEVGRTVVTDALALLRRQISGDYEGISCVDGVTLSRAFPDWGPEREI